MFGRMRSRLHIPALLLVAGAVLIAGLACDFSFNIGNETEPPATPVPSPVVTRAPTLPPVQATQPPQPQGDEVYLTVMNQSSSDVCFMRISPVTSQYWGDDWLGSDILGAGSSYTFGPIPAGMYDLRAEFCGGSGVEEYGFDLTSDASWTVTGGTGTGPQGGDVQLIVVNQTSETICFVRISAGQDWGDDWLGADVIQAGSQYTFFVEPGMYDLRAEFCGNAEPVEYYQADLTSSGTWTIGQDAVNPGSGSSGGGLDWSLDANYGEVSLSSGFTPDPYGVNMTSGGAVNVATLGLGAGCSGYATSAPDFELNYTSGSFSLLRIFFLASSGDTTLVINGPTGQWYCNDDSFGSLNPTIDFQNPSSGPYDVWVGSYSSGDFVQGTLYITEVSGNHP